MINYHIGLLFLGLNLVIRMDGLENGLARTPPMGWMSWAAFFCEIDCENHPHDCINERLYVTMADAIVAQGFREAGYKSIHIDDCWMEMQRDPNGRLVANRTRFPSGIGKLAKMMHDRGLKLGIYEDYGEKTCAGYPGSKGFVKIDANTFADWEVDYLKFDGCYSNESEVAPGFSSMSRALLKTRKKIVFSCEWPLYLRKHPQLINYTDIASKCNSWRSYEDVQSNWESILAIVDFYVENQNELARVQGPGAWNDPDMLVIGNDGLTLSMSQSQMSLWCIWSAPLLISTDLRKLKGEFRSILLNKEAISIDQDPLGKLGKMVYQSGSLSIFLKPIQSLDPKSNETDYALAVLNRNQDLGIHHELNLSQIGINSFGNDYSIREIWSSKQFDRVAFDSTIRIYLKPAQTMLFVARKGKRSFKSYS